MIIHTSLSPNNTWRDNLVAVHLLLTPWAWRRGRAVEKLEKEFRHITGSDWARAVGSGREALYLILKNLDLSPGDEILVQSFTCMVVINAIVWNGLRPVYLDIDESYNFTSEELSRKCTAKTKAVIVQHTFGIPAQMENIQKVCRQKNLLLIEDCAHALGATDRDKPVGSWGDAAFYSLGRSKVISCVNGGVIITNNKNLQENLETEMRSMPVTSGRKILQNLLHPLIGSLAKFLYRVQIGKFILLLAQKLQLINLEVTPAEKRSVRPGSFPEKLSNAMALMALTQLKQLKKFNQHRKSAANFYEKHLKVGQKINTEKYPGAIFLRYPLRVKNPSAVISAAKKAGIILGDWYSTPIAPPDIDTSKTGYQSGSCPRTEIANLQMINLPTHQGLKSKDFYKIVQIVNQNAAD